MTVTKQKTKGTPNEMDIHVGQRLKVRRALLGLSQEKLAESVGLTFQQIQKYERGTNRVSAGRLFDLSKTLDVPISYFFEQFNKITSDKPSMALGMSDNDQDGFSHDDIMSTKETLDLVRTYYAIKDPEARKDIMKFVKSMAERLGE